MSTMLQFIVVVELSTGNKGDEAVQEGRMMEVTKDEQEEVSRDGNEGWAEEKTKLERKEKNR